MKFALLALALGMGCSADHGQQDADLACSTDCTAPPANTCSGGMYTVWSTGSCVNGTCAYASTQQPCTQAQGLSCNGDRCEGLEYNCSLCGDSKHCDGDTLVTEGHTCTEPAGPCEHPSDLVTMVDCSTMTTPPAPTCVGDVAVTYGTTATCGGQSPFYDCVYPKTSVDCAATNQTCSNGACI